ncbi:MAG: NADH-quinone oxidoreductase subunit L [Phycisphaerales bacterium]|nr:NADH-quinone oxidoreductase subunit L [Phycisphaerales bacterium]
MIQMISTLLGSMPALAAAPGSSGKAAGQAVVEVGTGPAWVLLIPFLPLLGFVLCAIYAAIGNKSKLPAWTTVGLLAVSFVATVSMFVSFDGPYTVHAFDWIQVHFGEKSLIADFSFYVDKLTILWMLFVTGLATLIALYASEYMSHDIGTGYCRFFSAFGLFVFSMACLVMGDNLLMLYLGWEGVGLCSYLLIGYFYKKPSAVAAAKKAFIVNRIGDLGLALGIYLIFVHFGTLEYTELFNNEKLLGYVADASRGDFSAIPGQAQWIALLLMVGAFGKSAQFPLYVWLPVAMEGPTPVSALIHAATMVTAGVYLIARMYPVFLVSEFALPTVAWIGTITAVLAATIGMAQFDIKRIMAYSTVSQLGYMFAGLGLLTTTGAAFHVLTHAFFKALLFLACGAVMHGFAGQLDLRKLSGVSWMKGWGIVGVTMLIGCMNLAGLPYITSGFYSKDMILAGAFTTPGYSIIGWLLVGTAILTAYYTFRVYFRVFVGPQHAEPGEDYHGDDDHGFHPHPPGWAVNLVLCVLAFASIAAISLAYINKAESYGWVGSMVQDSSAYFHSPYADAAYGVAKGEVDPVNGPVGYKAPVAVFGMTAHNAMILISGAGAIPGVLIAAFFHGPKGWQGLFIGGRTEAGKCRMDAVAKRFGPIPKMAENKWYVDEFYQMELVGPLRVLSHVLHWLDKLLVDGLVNLFGFLPRLFAWVIRPSQSGVLQGYAVSMVGGVVILLVVVMVVVLRTGGAA